MYKLAGRILDSYDDPNFIDDVRTQALIGSKVKDIPELDTLSDGDFAVCIKTASGTHRRYPIYNPFITGVSMEYFEAAEPDMPENLAKTAGYYLGKACEIHGIDKTAAVSKYTDSCEHVVDISQPDSYPNVESSALYSREQLVKAAELSITRAFADMTPLDRVKAATDFVKQAGEMAVNSQEMWDYYPKTALGPSFERALSDRKLLLKEAEGIQAEDFDVLVRDLRNMTPDKAAESLFEFDKRAGLNDRYSEGLTDPYKAAYGGFWMPSRVVETTETMINGLLEDSLDKTASVEECLEKLSSVYPKHSINYDRMGKVLSHISDLSNRVSETAYDALSRHFRL